MLSCRLLALPFTSWYFTTWNILRLKADCACPAVHQLAFHNMGYSIIQGRWCLSCRLPAGNPEVVFYNLGYANILGRLFLSRHLLDVPLGVGAHTWGVSPSCYDIQYWHECRVLKKAYRLATAYSMWVLFQIYLFALVLPFLSIFAASGFRWPGCPRRFFRWLGCLQGLPGHLKGFFFWSGCLWGFFFWPRCLRYPSGSKDLIFFSSSLLRLVLPCNLGH